MIACISVEGTIYIVLHNVETHMHSYVIQNLHGIVCHTKWNAGLNTEELYVGNFLKLYTRFALSALSCIMFGLVPTLGYSLQWRHNDRDGLPNHRRLGSLLNRLFRRRSKKISKPRVTGLCEGNSPVSAEFPSQRTSNTKTVSIWWRHDVHWHWGLTVIVAGWRIYAAVKQAVSHWFP